MDHYFRTTELRARGGLSVGSHMGSWVGVTWILKFGILITIYISFFGMESMTVTTQNIYLRLCG